jgi:hypothetical protein
MSTKYGILSVGFIGCLGFVAGLFYYHTAITLYHATLAAGEQTHQPIVRMQIFLSKILLFGGFAVMIISTICYLLYRKWEKRNHDT